MASRLHKSKSEDYELAIEKLNTLQSNFSLLKLARKQKKANPEAKLKDMRNFLQRCDITKQQADSLPIIHVSGTQGKGSTCAMIESILRARGLRTGFFSSPHLIEVRERIRLDGEPLSFSAFTHHFWSCYNRLIKTMDEHNPQMPFYFAFLTLMSLDVFISERPDVCIIEVGIGGEYDCTNIFTNPRVCGVTSLGYDHTDILGESLDEIAWNKAGIFKSGTPCYVQSCSPSVHQVFLEKAKERGVKELYLIPALSPYGLPRIPKLSLQGEFQLKNAALAVQIAKRFISQREKRQVQMGSMRLLEECTLSLDDITSEVEEGLQNTKWPGRAQVIEKSVPNWKRVVFYLDGAHTPQALQCAVEWFIQARRSQERTSTCKKGIVLNLTGNRDHTLFLEKIRDLEVEHVFFCPNIAYSKPNTAPDTASAIASSEQQLIRCKELQREWNELTGVDLSQSVSNFSEVYESLSGSEEGREYHILVTGSLYLVSAALQFLS
ncbi:Folylpolyglutamate synthase, mitochondrial isoform X1 [Oopsacas minuta]|uniref:Folylpolyglutamate synthase n=1 Tax=Oopsacas minuta TaxID=111878 RepID=A0AAV7JCL4_9METZ|nr:Folylpolyglutamate synthase, mitochondrial isoform X1 [Oopsacas minuta]